MTWRAKRTFEPLRPCRRIPGRLHGVVPWYSRREVVRTPAHARINTSLHRPSTVAWHVNYQLG
eukprot:772727-Amphidinium_carterae.1